MSDTFVPPAGVAEAAKRALGWISDGHAGGGFTDTGRARASQLANRNAVSKDTISRMVSFFARHEVDKKAEGFNQGEKGFPSPGRVAWDAWGGDAGKSWAESVASKFNKEKATMANDFANSYAAIVKQEKQEDGSLLVYGKATDDSLDIDQQICDDTWLSAAMPEWFKTGGNIREQHSSIAAGVAKEYEAKADGHYISVLVVDPVSVKKVESGVLKGFSIGIKSPRVVRDQKAANGRIIDGQIVEVSLVDRPANPNAKLMLAKSVDGETSLVKVEEYTEKADKPDYANMLPGGEKSEPADADLYAKVKAEAKQKFDVYPSAVANAWVVNEYKKRGGKYKAKSNKSLSGNESKMLAEVIKELHADSTKFDKASYDAARKGLAQLIISEASEIGDMDSDERDDIETLLAALKHLFNFRDGEIDEDQEAGMLPMIELSAMSDEMKSMHKDGGCADCECDGCQSCDGCDGDNCKMCKCGYGMAAKFVGKCLQCGCGAVGDDHGKTVVQIPGNNGGIRTTANVSTATIVTPEQNAGSIKSADAETPVDAPVETPADEAKSESVVEEVKEEIEKIEEKIEEEVKDILGEKFVTSILEKATKSASEIVKAEIASYETALKAAEEKSVALESELVIARSAAAKGGPKRTGRVVVNDSNELLIKAAEYRLKASATSDPILAKGYKALEKEYLSKASGNSSDE
jgi:Family of unknown function (DUF5872)